MPNGRMIATTVEEVATVTWLERRELAAIATAVDAELRRPWPRFRRWLAVTLRRAA